MTKQPERHWQFACPECGFGHLELEILAADDELYCELCLEETGRQILLHRWIVEPEFPADDCLATGLAA